MCGIVGLFVKNPELEPDLGRLLASMLATMGDRGPDSAGFAVYGRSRAGRVKLTLRVPEGGPTSAALGRGLLEALGAEVDGVARGTHLVVSLPGEVLDQAQAWLRAEHPGMRVTGAGERMELYKEVGAPDAVARRFELAAMGGTHAIGHTRMATESAVTTAGAHPYSTGTDQCLVHNGSLSNHNAVRRRLERAGLAFDTDNDSEVAAGYLTWRLSEGASLQQALEAGLLDLDGFYTFVVGTRTGFAVLRDPIACKPAGDGRDRRLRRLRLGVPGAGDAARHRRGQGVRAAAGHRLRLGADLMPSVDLAASTVRNLNAALHRLRPETNETAWQVLNPGGRHAVAVGLDLPVTVEIEGHVGYYCAGMNAGATILVHGNAGVGLAENMMSGTVRVRGDASQAAGATGRGGLLVVEGNAAARCGISMKGIDIVVQGSIGPMSAFMAQAGNLVVMGDAGEALGDSLYEARLFVRGGVKSLGADCVEKPMDGESRAVLQSVLARAELRHGVDPEEFRLYGSARRLYHFHVDNLDTY